MTEESSMSTKPRRRWYTVFSLSAAAFVDSGENETLAILWPKMYPALSMKVSDLGPVLGISGLVSTFTLPLWGWAADRFSRKTLLTWITGFWGIWTLVIAFVQSLTQLLLVRVLVSLGLGVLWPAAFSLLSDLFPSKERGRAAGVMTAVSFMGTLVSFFVLPALAAISPEGWRYGFILMGLVSALTGILFIFINDPVRGSAEPEIRDVISEATVGRYAFRLADLPAIARISSWWVLLFQQSFDNIAMAVLYGWSFTWLDTLGLGSSAPLVVGVLTLGTLLGHLAIALTGRLVEALGGNITTMLLIMIPLPKLISTLLWIPVFRTYPRDRQSLHRLLLRRRDELLGPEEIQ